MRAALGDADLVDRGAAAQAGLALAAVDRKGGLGAAGRAVRLAIPVDAGPLGVNGGVQHDADRLVEQGDLAGAQAGGRAQRMDLRTPERLVGVDVADAGHDALVEQHGLDRGLAPGEPGGEVRDGELMFERFRPEHRGEAGEIGGQRDEAELARVGKAQLLAAVELHANMHPAVRLMRGLIRRHVQAAGHFQVNDQQVMVEMAEDVFGATGDGAKGLAVETRAEVFRRGPAQHPRPIGPDVERGAADQRAAQPADDGFDFGQFRHGSRVQMTGSALSIIAIETLRPSRAGYNPPICRRCAPCPFCG